MPRYAPPRALRRHAGPRILLALTAEDELDEAVRAVRERHPKPAVLVVAVPPGTYGGGGLGRFQWAMNHPLIDVACLGTASPEELAISWNALLVRP